jgi:hypothetical protein
MVIATIHKGNANFFLGERESDVESRETRADDYDLGNGS